MGRAMAELFAREGAKVVLGDLNTAPLDELVTQIRAAGGEALAVQVNVSKVAQVNAFVDAAVSAHGRLDVLCNNAGILDNFVPAAEIDDDLWERVMAVNVSGPMYATRRALPIMTAQGGGVIINTASVGGQFGGRAGTAYTASKHALIGLTRNVAWTYLPQGVRCVAIAPGGVATGIGSSITVPNPLGMARLAPLSLDRMGVSVLQAEEIARAALFLASDDAKGVNGAVLTVDGGWTVG
ncbi:3-ketoacyl-ACP reductase [Deinococcus aquiradiocola]|uniref:3-ketoacyl-ACP reductase n=2 Tax=Deinococcus aquiradiocola TaxID=393059 RepID=A0A917UR03_9DEIO|nr:3-ketoacyl-ACP reductase [Deinococcus aquiradiocola]